MPNSYFETKFNQALHSNDICEHVPTLRRYASLSRTITEFGVRDGFSTIGLLAGYPQFMTSYDISPPGSFLDLEQTIKEAQSLGISYQFIQQDVRSLAEIVPTDLLFIDTLHTYAQLRFELEHFAKYVQKFIILHDTVSFAHHDEIPGTGKSGLIAAITDFLLDTDWEVGATYPNCNGLTILSKL